MKELADFNMLWDYNKPEETRLKFLELLPEAEASGDASYHAQLLTQIARTQSLQAKFDEAHIILDKVEKILTPDLKLAHIRYLLERGRTYNSSRQPEKAMPLFEEAFDIGKSTGEIRYAIDAVHMIAIAQPDPQEQINWNLKRIAMAEADTNSRKWLWALYNNIGESYAAMKDYQNALIYFRKLIEFQKEKGEPDIYTLKDEARMLRLSGYPLESLEIIDPVINKLLIENKDNGWMREEVAEALYAIGKIEEAKAHFKKAYELLSNDEYCMKYEQEKIERLKMMAGK